MGAQLSIDNFLLLIRGVKQNGANWLGQCPAHDDQTASLSIGVGREGRILLKCFAGCDVRAITNALNLTVSQLLPTTTPKPLPRQVATYDYTSADGKLLYQVVRFEPKDFRQRQPSVSGAWDWHMKGVQRIPYRLNEVKGRATIYVVEGEKDADTLWALGCPATTNVGGAGKWRSSDSQALVGVGVTKCVLIPDNDGPGRKHMAEVELSLKSVGIAVVRVNLEEVRIKGDVSLWLAQGHTIQELEARVSKTPFVVPRGFTPADETPAENDPHGALRWAQTQLGAAEAFVDRCKDQLRWDHLRERWLVWNCHHWRPDATREVERLNVDHLRKWQHESLDIRDKAQREFMLKFVTSYESRGHFDAMMKFAKSLDGVKSDGHEWDDGTWLLGCPNGVIDLKTGTLRDGSQADYITRQIGTLYDPSALAPAWESFLLEVFDDDLDVVHYVQMALGYSLSGSMSEQCFFMLVGQGSNGKSTFLSAMESVWGDYAYTTSMATFTVSNNSDNDFNIAELNGPRVILASETKTDCRINEQLIKNFTGGERINAQRKHGHPFVYRPVGKIWIGLNQQPTVKDDSIGFWRRVRVINFPRAFTGSAAKLHLLDTLRAEAPGILAWAVRGCLAWQQQGFTVPKAVWQAGQDYQDTEDPLREFVLECLDLDDPQAEEGLASVYESYTNFSVKMGTPPRFVPSRKSFGRSLSRRFAKRESNGKVIYRGLRVKVRAQERLYDCG